MHNPIIQSLLDTDLYKYTMQQSMVRRYPEANARMAFQCRDAGPMQLSVAELRKQCDLLGELRLTHDELNWLSELPFISDEFVDYLQFFRLDPRQIDIQNYQNELFIEVTGNWAEISHFEIFILALISQLHGSVYGVDQRQIGEQLLADKIQYLSDALESESGQAFQLVDFGTRRRFSRDWHHHVVSTLQQQLPDNFVGTSNLHLARTLGLKPVGTMAHEWLQSHQVLGESLITSQKDALWIWLKEYGDQLGVALTDTINMQAFLRDFDEELANAFAGIRHDSGDPVQWGDEALKHYRKLGIDPKTKSFVFSDKLDFETAIEIHRHFNDQVNVSFGIGTYLTNDMGYRAPNIVLKLVELNGLPVAKLSDSPGKTMCQDQAFVSLLKQTFQYQ